MKQNNNIFEELNKMKSLIKAKPGTVISEQEIQEIGFGAAAAATTGGRTPEATKTINSTFCNVKNGKISSGYFEGQPWSNYKTKYSVTAAEEAEAQKSCPSVKTGIVAGSGGNKNNDYSRMVGDYSKKVQTGLGITPTGQLSDNDLEKVLGQLNGEVSGEVNQTVQGLPTTADGQPDLEKILASLSK